MASRRNISRCSSDVSERYTESMEHGNRVPNEPLTLIDRAIDKLKRTKESVVKTLSKSSTKPHHLNVESPYTEVVPAYIGKKAEEVRRRQFCAPILTDVDEQYGESCCLHGGRRCSLSTVQTYVEKRLLAQTKQTLQNNRRRFSDTRVVLQYNNKSLNTPNDRNDVTGTTTCYTPGGGRTNEVGPSVQLDKKSTNRHVKIETSDPRVSKGIPDASVQEYLDTLLRKSPGRYVLQLVQYRMYGTVGDLSHTENGAENEEWSPSSNYQPILVQTCN